VIYSLANIDFTTHYLETEDANPRHHLQTTRIPTVARRPFDFHSWDIGNTPQLHGTEAQDCYETAPKIGYPCDRDRPSTSSRNTLPVSPSPSPVRNGVPPGRVGWEDYVRPHRRDPELELMHRKCDHQYETTTAILRHLYANSGGGGMQG
jgi:hypothetical protein